MKAPSSFLALGLLALAGCSGGSSPAPGPGPAPKPIDPSGNWTMTAADSGNKSIQFAALFSQTGSVVTANSFTAAGNPAPFACVPFSATLSNGQVQNVSNFTGTVTLGGNFGAFTFNTTLAQDGKSFSGNYAAMPPCSSVLSSGNFTGAEVPTTSGSWSGSLQPCNFDQTTGTCASLIGSPGTFTASLTQDDATGNVTGTYTVTNVAGLTNGNISVAAADQDILSGTVWQFTMLDANGAKFIANGTLDLKGGFAGVVLGPSSTHFQLTITH